MTSPRVEQWPIGSTRLATIIRDPEHVSPRIELGVGRVDAARVAEFKVMLEEDLRALPEPLCVESHGSLILADGHHRVAALERLALEHPGDRRFEFISVRVGSAPSGQLPADFAFEVALECSAKGPLPLSRPEKQAAIERLLTTHPEWSDRQVARSAGVDHKTVGAARKRGVPQPEDEAYAEPGHAQAALTSAVRLTRIAAQIVRYGDEVGAQESGLSNEDIVVELADRTRQEHPDSAHAWADWWAEIWKGVQDQLRGPT